MAAKMLVNLDSFENADTKLQNVNISNVEDVQNMFNTPVNNILPSITILWRS